MLVSGQSFVPGYINFDDLVEGAVEGVPEHRQQTRQRHLSSGDDDIASNYFASQYGQQQQLSRHNSKANSKTNSKTNSRRNSLSNKFPCSNSFVQSTMASAAAKIAQLKQQEREETIVKYKEQNSRVQQQTHHSVYTEQNTSDEQHHRLLNGSQVSESHFTSEQTNGSTLTNGDSASNAHASFKGSHNGANGQFESAQSETAPSLGGSLNLNGHESTVKQQYEEKTGLTSRRGSSQFSYLSLLPEDGSFPHRTQPIGDPVTKKTSSAAPTPDRELGRKWSICSSTDYLNKAGKASYAARSNPIGLAEPSVKRDGYAVGRDGSMYRSTGNLNVAGGTQSRAGSEAREPSSGNWKERRSSAADVKGSGIRIGGNLIEPSSKPPPNFFMPFGSSSAGFNKQRKICKTSVQTSTSSTTETTHIKRERNKTISGESHSSAMEDLNQALNCIQTKQETETVNVTLPRRTRGRAHSMPRAETSVEESTFTVSLPGSRINSRQTSVEPEGRKKLTRQGSVEIFDAAYNLTVPNKMSRHSSQTKLEEVHADHFYFPGMVQEVPSVVPPVASGEPSVKCIAVSVHKHTGENIQKEEMGEQRTKGEIFTSELSSLASEISQYTSHIQEESIHQSLNNSSTNYTQSNSTSSTHSSTESSMLSHTQSQAETSSQSFNQSQAVTQSFSQSQAETSSQSFNQSQAVTQSVSQSQAVSQSFSQSQAEISSHSSAQSFNKSEVLNNLHSTTNSIQSNSSHTNSQHLWDSRRREAEKPPCQGGAGRSRHSSGSNGTVVQGNRFNITNGLKRGGSRAQSDENLESSSRQQTVDLSTGSAMQQLDSALQQYVSHQQQQDADKIQYVAKVSSRQTSRRCSVVVNGGGDVTNVTISLPPSRTGSRRSSVDQGKSSRRNSLDIYTAEYAVRLGTNKKIDTLLQKSSFHIKVDNEAESGLNLCGRCHLPTHRTGECTEYNDFVCPRCLSWDHWDDSCPLQDNEYACTRCNFLGHLEEVHEVSSYTQRRTCVDLLGWQPFQTWFYQTDFRNWWQVTGCIGVPLYKVYPRKSEWRRDRQDVNNNNNNNNNSNNNHNNNLSNGVTRIDSVDDMIAQVLSQRKEYSHHASAAIDSDSSGRSTPRDRANKDDILKKPRKLRTFSETLRSLDDDILAELDVK